MIRYYWYVTVDPKTSNRQINARNYIRRNYLTLPPDDLFYIMETVDGYNHTIKDKLHVYPSTTTNDMGIPLTIHNIAEQIKSRLEMQWTKDYDRATTIRDAKIRGTPMISTMDEGDADISDLRYTYNMGGLYSNTSSINELLASSRKKSGSVRKIKRRIKPKCTCTKKPIRKVK